MSQFDDAFTELLPALSPHLQQATPTQIRAALQVEGIDADAAEDFLSSLGHAASAIGSAVAPRLPGIIQGAIGGAQSGMAAGPYGALIGALGGGLAGGLGAPGAAPAAAPAGAAPGAGGAAAAAGPTSALMGAGGGAAGSLLGLLTQPQVMQGLMAMLAGNAGAKSVPVAGQQVPPAALANMVAHYANAAAAEWEEKSGTPAEATLPSLSESADEAERAEALAEAIAVEAWVRSLGPPVAEFDGAEADWSDWSEADWEADSEADYGDAAYDPVYLGA